MWDPSTEVTGTACRRMAMRWGCKTVEGVTAVSCRDSHNPKAACVCRRIVELLGVCSAGVS